MGRKVSTETRAKLSAIQLALGQKRTPERHENFRRKMVGRKHSEETKRKRTESLKAYWLTHERPGRKCTPEQREAIRERVTIWWAKRKAKC